MYVTMQDSTDTQEVADAMGTEPAFATLKEAHRDAKQLAYLCSDGHWAYGAIFLTSEDAPPTLVKVVRHQLDPDRLKPNNKHDFSRPEDGLAWDHCQVCGNRQDHPWHKPNVQDYSGLPALNVEKADELAEVPAIWNED